MLATESRIEAALGRPPADFGEMLGGLAHRLMPPRPAAIWQERSTLLRALSMRKATVNGGPAAEVEEPPDLSKFPILKLWPQDGGRFITFPLVGTEDPVTKVGNLGVYRMHVHDNTTTGMHWQIQKGGGFHYHRAEMQNQALPVTVTLGGDPILLICAVAPLPEGIDELAFAGFLRGRPVRLMKAKTSNLRAPADAEFILEGHVPPVERKVEGPFGDHFGHYSHAAPFPVLHIDRISRRRNPIYPAAVVGKPPQEDKFIGNALQEMTLPILKVMHPEVTDAWAYYETGFHSLLVVSVLERYHKEAVKTALGLLGTGQLSLTKCLIAVGPDVPVRDFRAVLRAVRDNFDPSRDFLLLPGTPYDTLDFASFTMNLGSKMILDATPHRERRGADGNKGAAGDPKGAAEHTDFSSRDFRRGHPNISGAAVLENVLLVCQVTGDPAPIRDHFLGLPRNDAPPLVALVSPDVDLDDMENLLWGLFTRFDPARDVRFASETLRGAWPVYSGRMVVDATWKNGYPDPVSMDPDVLQKVDRRWTDYWK
jgi:UbiD family decarboxylase